MLRRRVGTLGGIENRFLGLRKVLGEIVKDPGFGLLQKPALIRSDFAGARSWVRRGK